MKLPNEKIEKIRMIIKKYLRRGYIMYKELKKLNSSLCHAALAMLWANGLFAPVNNALSKTVNICKLDKNSLLHSTLQDFSIIISLLEKTPTPLAQLVLASPDITGKVDTSKYGAGGI